MYQIIFTFLYPNIFLCPFYCCPQRAWRELNPSVPVPFPQDGEDDGQDEDYDPAQDEDPGTPDADKGGDEPPKKKRKKKHTKKKIKKKATEETETSDSGEEEGDAGQEDSDGSSSSSSGSGSSSSSDDDGSTESDSPPPKKKKNKKRKKKQKKDIKKAKKPRRLSKAQRDEAEVAKQRELAAQWAKRGFDKHKSQLISQAEASAVAQEEMKINKTAKLGMLAWWLWLQMKPAGARFGQRGTDSQRVIFNVAMHRRCPVIPVRAFKFDTFCAPLFICTLRLFLVSILTPYSLLFLSCAAQTATGFLRRGDGRGVLHQGGETGKPAPTSSKGVGHPLGFRRRADHSRCPQVVYRQPHICRLQRE